MRTLIAQQAVIFDTEDPNAHRTAAFAVLFTFHPDFPLWILNYPLNFPGLPMPNAKGPCGSHLNAQMKTSD